MTGWQRQDSKAQQEQQHQGAGDCPPGPIAADEAAAAEPEEHLDKADKASNNNAFKELMSAAKKHKSSPTPENTSKTKPAHTARRRMDSKKGLGEYLPHPERNPAVIEYDDEFVVIRDMYPKASVHLLLLPRNPTVSNSKQPVTILQKNAEFLASVNRRVEHLKQLAASELRRLFGQESEKDKPYQQALGELMSSENPPPPEECNKLLPPGRDWTEDIVVGVHAHPSMDHLHIHVFSRDMQSPWMRRRSHYNSFATDFLFRIEEFPLKNIDERWERVGDWHLKPLICWRCQKNFGDRFAKFKEHLAMEFDQWKQL